MRDAWPQYLAGVPVLATGAVASGLVKAWRRRRPAPENLGTATGSQEARRDAAAGSQESAADSGE